jgi:hypothetical protein
MAISPPLLRRKNKTEAISRRRTSHREILVDARDSEFFLSLEEFKSLCER